MSTTPPDWQCTWHTGPDAGGIHPLPPGRHLVGRSPTAAIRCDDPAMQPHHAVLDVRGDGVWLTQLADRVPVRVAGLPVNGTTALEIGDHVELGASLLVLEAFEPPRPAVAVLRDGVVRGPRPIPRWAPAELTPPAEVSERSESMGGLVPALIGLGGAAVIALLLHQPMFLVFGALGALVALGSWGAQRGAARRRRARDRSAAFAERAMFEASLAADRDAFLRWHESSVPTAVTARRTLTGLDDRLWHRRADHPDAHVVSVGLGDLAWRTMPIADPHAHPEPLHLPDLAVPVALGPGARVALQGAQAPAIARACIAQLLASCGPADARIVVVTRHPEHWRCLRELPHLRLPDGTAAITDGDSLADTLDQLSDESHHGHGVLLLVTDDAAGLATRTSALRRALHGDGTALLAVLPEHESTPHVCTSILTTGAGPTGRWVCDTATTLLPVPVRLAGMSEATLARCSARLAGLHDPEDPLAAAGRLPRSVAMHELIHGGADAVLERWHAHGDPAPRTPIGMAADGIVDLDLVRDGPHALVAGTTGAGKSELLRSMVVGMAAHSSPEHLSFVLVDYKGGAAFDMCAHLPHVVGTVTDLDDRLADRALRSLHAELRRREAVLREHGAADLGALRLRAPWVVLPRLVVVVDEFAALVAEQPDFLHSLVGVAQRGRSLGVHLVLATQRPHGVISDDIRANTNLRIALRLHDPADAIDVVGQRSPAQLPRTLPGRAVMRLGADEHVTFQTAQVHAALVADIQAAASRVPCAAVAPPWQPPLPSRLSRTAVPPGALGLADDPDRQRVVPVQWRPGDGSVVVAGSAGSGVSTALHTLASAALTDPSARVYVLTAGHSAVTSLDEHPRCVAVDVSQRERTARLLRRLRDDRSDEPLVFVVDDLPVVQRALDDLDTARELDTLTHLLTTDRPDTVVLVGCDRPSAIPPAVLARCAQRWVMHLHDALDAGTMGVPVRAVPGQVAGRVFMAERGLAAQLVVPGHTPFHDGSTPRLPPVEATPTHVRSLTARANRADDTAILPVGPSLEHDGVGHLELPEGDHLMVLGGARTGRSTALARLVCAWREAHDGRVLAVLARRAHAVRDVVDAVVGSASDLTIDDRGPLLVVVDDAELVDDPTGVLAALAAGRRADRTVMVAGRPDALRQSYGHWSSVVRRSRLGLVAAGGGDLDGDLLGATLPRRTPVDPRPGLMWIVQQGTAELVQVALAAAQPTACAHAASASAAAAATSASLRPW
ncbi:MAG: hypothetical protein HY828_18250 [Actinobacteria bacterium]|nr:hypothetical protein [Actinomycetota bacterium]